MEQIDVKPVYDNKDLTGMEHLGYVAGIAPFYGDLSDNVRNKAMDSSPIRRFSTAEESNAFYRRNLAAGQKGFPSRSTWRHTAAMIPIIRE